MNSRFRAGLVHLAISAVVALIAVGLVFQLWYPAPLHAAVGVTDIFLIVLGVDVVIGPLLTTLVYKVGKKSLRFDLATIALLQLSAFAYGLWTVSEGRPAWLVFSADRFDLVQAYEVDQRKISDAKPEFRKPSWWGPGWAYARRAQTPEERQDVILESLTAGIDSAQRPNFYLPLADGAEQIRQHAKPLTELARFNAKSTVDATLAKWPAADAFLPMMARVNPVTVLINKESAQVVAIVDLNPWE